MGFTTAIEAATGVASLLVLVVYLRQRWKVDSKVLILVILLSIPALFLSVESMNTFLTCDESYLVYEPVDLVNSSLPMWKMGAFRTTDLFVGIPLVAIKTITGFSMDILAVFAKSLHWLLSFLLVVVIVDQMSKLANVNRFHPGTYLLMMYSVLLLPVVTFAMKIINYDALSLLFGVASVLLLANGWRGSRLSMYSGIFFAALAAQEKLIASPLVWVCLIIVPLRTVYRCKPKTLRDTVRIAFKPTVITTISTLSVFILSHLLVSTVNQHGAPDENVFGVFYPLLTAFWPLFRTIGVNISMVLAANSFTDWLYIPAFIGVVIVGVLFVVMSASILMRWLASPMDKYAGDNRYLRRFEITTYLLFFFLYVGGMVVTFTCSAFLAPFYPVEAGMYAGYRFNDASLCFGARSLFAHTLLSICWADAIMVNALPLVLPIMAIFNVYQTMVRKRTPDLFLTTAFLLSISAPLVYGLLQVPVSNRYVNLFLLVACCKIVIDFITGFRGTVKPVAAALVILLLTIEIVPFRPLFGSFRPLWSGYSKMYNTTPSKGVLNPWWMGWGEEVSIAGRRLEKKLQASNPELAGVTLYSNYLGEWLFRQNSARVVQLDTVSSIGYSENDYFILNRMGVTLSPLNFPHGVAPVDVVSFRGFDQAWLFKGSDLARAGFRFREAGLQGGVDK